MILPDTSIWVAYLRPGSDTLTRELADALEQREVLACGPVVAELLAGAQPRDRPELLISLAGLPWADLNRSDWQNVGLLAAELRDQVQKLPLTDLEIAVAANTSGATLWTGDQDFRRIEPLLDELKVRFAT